MGDCVVTPFWRNGCLSKGQMPHTIHGQYKAIVRERIRVPDPIGEANAGVLNPLHWESALS